VREETPWRLTMATVTDCRRTFATSMIDETAISDEGYQAAEFTITFSYIASGQTYFGKYKAGSPEEPGHTFEIQFDPSHPERNTGSDLPRTAWTTVTAVIVGGAIALLLIWLSHRMLS
jgi:hypothetical protein